jgi:hypothetical protein
VAVQCNHPAMATGEVAFDLRRKTKEKGTYAACLSIAICPDCGRVELYADAPQSLSEWLTGKRELPKDPAA